MSFSMELATALAANPTPICTTSEGGLIGTITEWLITLMETIGGIGVALAAGFNRMNFLQFTGWTLLGSAVWNTILVSAGYLLGDQWCSIQGALGVFEDVVIVAVVVVIVWFAVKKVRTVVRNRKTQHGE